MTESFIHPSADCEPGAVIGAGTKIWRFTHVMAGAQIGSHVSIGQGCFVASTVRIGDRVRIQNSVNIFDGVTLDDCVFCGPGVTFTNVLFPRVEFPANAQYVPTRVGHGASLGANATIVAGVEIGRYAMIGAGSVVAADVPEFAVVAGNPARMLGWCSRRGEPLSFDTQGTARCSSGTRHVLRDERCLELDE